MKFLSLSLFGAIAAYDFEVFLRGGDAQIYTWREAKNYCQNLKTGWQLVIIDSEYKQLAVERAFLDAGAEDNDAAWIGYTNKDGWGANSANEFETLDIYGNRARYTNYAPGEPDNKRGNPTDQRGEDCVRMRVLDKKTAWEDALCGRRDTVKTRKGRKPLRNSFICEPRPDEILGSCRPEEEAPTDENYLVVPAETISFNEARESCQSKGSNWDLVTFESAEELQYVQRLINCLPEAFWIGYRENNGVSIDIFGNPASIEMPWLINKVNGDPDEPDEPDAECVRLRHGFTNDAICTRTWSGAMRDGVGMGYVCEKHTHLKAQPANRLQLEAEANGKQLCEENVWGVDPFALKRGCPAPHFCTATGEVIDAWVRGDKNTNRKNYGMAIKISVPYAFRLKNKGRGYSILIRFPSNLTRASFQSWNFNFFNFYLGGTEVLMHSKWYTAPNMDDFDPDLNSFVIIVENLDVKAHPQILAFDGRVNRHSCFDTKMHARGRSDITTITSEIRDKAQQKYGNRITLENVNGFSIHSGGLKRVKARGRKITTL